MITCIYFYGKIEFVKTLATVGNSAFVKELTELFTLLNYKLITLQTFKKENLVLLL